MDQDGQLICQSGDEQLAEQLVRIAREKTLKYQIRLDGKNYYLLKKALWEKNWDLGHTGSGGGHCEKEQLGLETFDRFPADFSGGRSCSGYFDGKTELSTIAGADPKPGPKRQKTERARTNTNKSMELSRSTAGIWNRLQIIQENQRISLQKELMQNLLEHDIVISAFSGDVASWIQINTWGEWFVLLLLKEEGLDFSELGLDNVVLLHVQPHGIPTLCLFAKEEGPLRQSLGTVEEYLQENGVVYTSGSVRCGWKQIHSAFLSLCERNESMQEPLETENMPAGKLSQRVVIVQGGEIARLTLPETQKKQSGCCIMLCE